MRNIDNTSELTSEISIFAIARCSTTGPGEGAVYIPPAGSALADFWSVFVQAVDEKNPVVVPGQNPPQADKIAALKAQIEDVLAEREDIAEHPTHELRFDTHSTSRQDAGGWDSDSSIACCHFGVFEKGGADRLCFFGLEEV